MFDKREERIRFSVGNDELPENPAATEIPGIASLGGLDVERHE